MPVLEPARRRYPGLIAGPDLSGSSGFGHGRSVGRRLLAACLVTFVTALGGGQVASARPIVEVEETRQPWRWPFSADSPWNIGVGSEAVFEGPGEARTRALHDERAWPWLNVEEYSQPIVRATRRDRLATVTTAQGPVVRYRIPAGAAPSGGTDGHLHVVDPSGDVLHEAWKMQGEGTTRAVGRYARTDLRSSGVGQGGVRAYGGSAIAGLIRIAELEVGRIPHALALALTDEQLGRGPVWPATEEDGNAARTYRGILPMGTYAAIPPGVDVTTLGLSREGVLVARALQRYGTYVVDRADAFTFFAEPGLDREIVARLRADIRAIRPHLRVVANNGPDRVNGGGEYRVRRAPPFAG